jgi:hypothetical protein
MAVAEAVDLIAGLTALKTLSIVVSDLESRCNQMLSSIYAIPALMGLRST